TSGIRDRDWPDDALLRQVNFFQVRESVMRFRPRHGVGRSTLGFSGLRVESRTKTPVVHNEWLSNHRHHEPKALMVHRGMMVNPTFCPNVARTAPPAHAST